MTDVNIVNEVVNVVLEDSPPVIIEASPVIVSLGEAQESVRINADEAIVVISPAGMPGIPGTPGVGSDATEIFVQQTQPAEGLTAWYWFQTDANGNLTGTEKVYFR